MRASTRSLPGEGASTTCHPLLRTRSRPSPTLRASTPPRDLDDLPRLPPSSTVASLARGPRPAPLPVVSTSGEINLPCTFWNVSGRKRPLLSTDKTKLIPTPSDLSRSHMHCRTLGSATLLLLVRGAARWRPLTRTDLLLPLCVCGLGQQEIWCG